jgi:hypothetical protein
VRTQIMSVFDEKLANFWDRTLNIFVQCCLACGGRWRDDQRGHVLLCGVIVFDLVNVFRKGVTLCDRRRVMEGRIGGDF